MLFAIIFSVHTAQAEVSSSEAQLITAMTQELLEFAADSNLDDVRAKKQVEFFKKYFEFELGKVGHYKFYKMDRWKNATAESRQSFFNVSSFVMAQFMVSHFANLLDYVNVNDKALARRIVADVKAKGHIKLVDVSSNGKRRIRVSPLVSVLENPKKVEFVAEIQNDKIVNVIVGEFQAGQKSGSSDATVKGIVMTVAVTHNSGQMITYDAEVENTIHASNGKLDPIKAYMQNHLKRYIEHIQKYPGVDTNLKLDFLLN